MIAGLLPPPGPPHDPQSILLNGRAGFRASDVAAGQVAAAIDPARCVVTLPRLASASRPLTEPTGSLGGMRAPSNVALGPDGIVYLLDRPGFMVKRFDPCACAFVPVRRTGGEGSGARQFRDPHGIAVGCGALYVSDTGNRRVSVFDLNGFLLRGRLEPAPGEPAWRPSGVAIDSMGRAWVADLDGRVHRFSRRGRWQQSWPIVPPPSHIAIDDRDRVYLVATGALPSLVVLDADGVPVPDPPTSAADLRGRLTPPPFASDAAGRLWLEAHCDPCAIRKADPRARLVFDASGNPLEVPEPAPQPQFAMRATYRSAPLDSGIAQCVWHRVILFGELPPGGRIRVRVHTADERVTTAELDSFASWRDCAIADAFDAGGRWDCLVRAEPGRFLWLELELEGDGMSTPCIGAMVVEFPRISLRRFLPAVYGMEPVSADFTDRFLALFDTPLRSIERKVDRMAHLFDPASAPAAASDPRQQDFLSWLGSWIGVALDRNWDVATRRRVLRSAGALFDRRGTLKGLREQLLLILDFARHAPCPEETRACGRCGPAADNCGPSRVSPPPEPPPLVLEHFRLRRWLRLGAGTLGNEAVVWGERIAGRTKLGAHGQIGVTRLDTSPDPEHDPFLVHAHQFSVFVPARCRDDERMRKSLENLLKSQAPAETRGYLHFVEPRFRIGTQSMLGFDSVIGALPQGVNLGASPLGGATVLTASATRIGNPPLALGGGRVGTTAHLG